MQIQIEKSAYVDRDFLEWLLLRLPHRVLRSMTGKKFLYAKKALQSAGVNIDPRRVLLLGCSCMRIKELKDAFVIEISSRAYVGSTNMTVKRLCSIVEYGNLDTRGSLIFTSVFRTIEEILPLLYSQYLKELI